MPHCYYHYLNYKRCKFLIFVLPSILTTFILTGCASAPESFIKAYEPSWASIEIRDNLTLEDAWQQVVDILAKKFELEMISKDGYYIRTSWIYTWWKVGERTENYRVRALVKFSANGKNVDIKTEANYLDDDQWILGYDNRLLETIKTDIMGVVGRTTR
jgi:hypothetical protein